MKMLACQRGSQDIDQRVAKQHRADQPLAVGNQRIDDDARACMPSASSRCMRAAEAAVSAVSEPENKRREDKQTRMIARLPDNVPVDHHFSISLQKGEQRRVFDFAR